MHPNNDESKGSRIRHLIHKCSKYVYFHAGPGAQQNKAITLLRNGSMSQKDLQEQLGVQPASVSEMISKLENKGLVERTRSDTDRRVVVLSLTEEGRKIDNTIREIQSNDDMFSGLNEEEQDQLIFLLDKLCRSFPEKDR